MEYNINDIIKKINNTFYTPNEMAQFLYLQGFEDCESALIVWLSEISGTRFLK